MSFRKFIFWIHLTVGIAAGLVIAVMCFTGTVLAFEKQIVAWAERDTRRIELPATGTPRIPFEELLARFRSTWPNRVPFSVTISAGPDEAVAFTTARDGVYYANPYTGEFCQPASGAARNFMRLMTDWHRWLALSGDQRAAGKIVTGIGNLAFLFLAVSGLLLWWPRKWRTKGLKRSLWFLRGTAGHARDWNWHNVIGFWCAPVLITLTLTALPISFRWAAELTYAITRTPLPASGPQSSGAPPPAAMVPVPAPDAQPASRDQLLAAVQNELPAWQSITFRFAPTTDPAKPQAASFVVREQRTWPRTATTTLQYDPFTGALLQRDAYSNLSAARKIRAWSRYLHTGEALGIFAQFVAAVASAGGCFLVYTGIALAYRRFFGPPRQKTP